MGVCGWEVTPEEHQSPSYKRKIMKPKQRGRLPVYLRNEGKSGEERSNVGAHKGIGVFNFFF